MALDPRFAANPLGIPDPSQAIIAGLRQEIGELRGRVAVLERAPTIQEIAGTPTTAPRNGTPAVDTSTPRLWIRRNGAWQFATLT